jgi:LPXTG-motif cell wall-anchored protein
VKVTATVDDQEYVAYTDGNGVAVFEDYDGENFPEGTGFIAELDGYGTVEWDQGDTVPEMKKDEDEEDNTLMFIIIAIVVLLLVVALFFMLRKKEEEPYYEE